MIVENIKGKRFLCRCDYCNKEFEEFWCNLKNNKNHFCGRSCYGKWISLNQSGENSCHYSQITMKCATCGKAIKRHKGYKWLVDKTFYSITYKTYDENEDNKIAEPIPEDKLCIRCKKNQRSVFDKELCDDCRFELIKLAEVKSREIREELKKDNMFKCLTSQEKAVAYVKDKYKKELSENKSLFLTSLAREEYNLTKINKI